jgi:tRNA(fMet)-specific endonuclease VapC
MKLVLDTNAYCRCDLGDEKALSVVEQARHLFLPAIAYGELYYGFRHGTRLSENLRRLNAFVDQFDVQVIPVDLSVARHYGDLYAWLRKAGRPIPTNDIWIAASTASIGGILLTVDAHFAQIEPLDVHLIRSP